MTVWTSRVCGIGDEAARDLATQLAIHQQLRLAGIELRTVDGRGLHELTGAEISLLVRQVDRSGRQVAALDTPLGSWTTTIATDFDSELEILQRSARVAKALDCRLLRVMSYPNDGRPEADWAAESLRRMAALASAAERMGAVLVHENCQGWAGIRAAHTVRMLQSVQSPHLRLAFDIGNGLAYGYDSVEFLTVVLPWVDHVHVKDGYLDPSGRAVFTAVGTGEADVAGCLQLLADSGYRGWYSLEPHVAHVPHLGVEADAAHLARSYREYAAGFRTLLDGVQAQAVDLRMPETTPDLTARAISNCWNAADLGWLQAVMAVPSVSPLEGGVPSETVRAQDVFVAGAVNRGFTVRYTGSPTSDDLACAAALIPAPVLAAIQDDPTEFLAHQPCVVLAYGDPAPPERRLVINFHIDTVGPHLPPRVENGILHGRGAVDDKGPGIAAAVGIAAAFALQPQLCRRMEVLLVSVPGEEGGAMGTFGTRWLVESGWTGRLMVFAEPTGGLVLDACTTAMTPRIVVDGMGSTDDHPGGGHNATVALGFLADHLARTLGPQAEALGTKFCIAGLRTGTAHNRVYGTGELLLNIAYSDVGQAEILATMLADALRSARTDFAAAHAGNPLTARTVADWDRVVRLEWLKRGLPVLNNRDPQMEAVLAAAGFPRHDGLTDGTAFTCDAIWAGAPDRYVAICGPGRLDTNGAHTELEHVPVEDLAGYSRRIRDLVLGFGATIEQPFKETR